MIDQCGVISKNAQQAEYEANAVSVYLGDTFNALSNLSNKKFIENVSFSSGERIFFLNPSSQWLPLKNPPSPLKIKTSQS